MGALAACGVAAVSLAAVLLANSVPHLPLGLDRYPALTLGLALATGLTTIIWPELAVPALIIGAGLLDSQLGGARVRHLVFIKLALFACGSIGVAFALTKRDPRIVRMRTPADAPALCLAGYTALSAAYGYLRAGHELDSVAVAGYHLSQLALYHFLVTTTLSRPGSLRRAGTIIVAWSLIWIIPSLLSPGRGGGTASIWLIVLLSYAAVSGAWWGVIAWAALPLALLDTLTSGYRTLWVSVAAQLGWLASCGLGPRLRRFRAAAAVLLVLCVLGGALLVSRPFLLKSLPAAGTLDRFSASLTDSGYRVPEALIGLAVLRQSPLFGGGVGYHTPPVWVETMGYMPVGPIYHLYYVSYLASEGVIGLAIVLWYFLAVLFSREARGMRAQSSVNRWAALGVGLQAAFLGATIAAFFSGPSDGYWTWGVLGAGSLLPAVWGSSRAASAGALGTARRPFREPHGETPPGMRASYGTG